VAVVYNVNTVNERYILSLHDALPIYAAKVAAYKDAWNALSADAKKYIDKDYEALIAEAEQLLVRPVLTYQTHVQNIGWQDYVPEGALSGTTGRSLRLEGIKINLTGVDGGVTYQTHVQNE